MSKERIIAAAVRTGLYKPVHWKRFMRTITDHSCPHLSSAKIAQTLKLPVLEVWAMFQIAKKLGLVELVETDIGKRWVKKRRTS
jgi:hypothetical protein